MVDLNTRRRSVDVAPTIQQDVSTSTSRPDVSKPSFKTGSRGAMPYSDKENDPPGLSVLPDSPSPHAFSRKEVRTKDTYLEISTLAQTPEHKTMSLPTPSPSVTGSSPLSTLSYGEDAFGYDPETLAEDPMDAIDFLNRTALSAVGRHKWMIAASHFRSKGNTKAALAVLNAMIKGKHLSNNQRSC